VLRGPKYTSEEIDAMDREDTALNIALQSKGKRRHYVENPTVQLCGPIAPIMLLSKESTHHRMGFGHNLGYSSPVSCSHDLCYGTHAFCCVNYCVV